MICSMVYISMVIFRQYLWYYYVVTECIVSKWSFSQSSKLSFWAFCLYVLFHTFTCVPWSLRSPITQLFVQQLVKTTNNPSLLALCEVSPGMAGWFAEGKVFSCHNVMFSTKQYEIEIMFFLTITHQSTPDQYNDVSIISVTQFNQSNDFSLDTFITLCATSSNLNGHLACL